MARKKYAFINILDVLLVLFIAACVVLTVVFASPNGKTASVFYTLTVNEGDVSGLSEGDVLTVISGGCLGSVDSIADGSVTASAEAEYHGGQYYSGSVALKDGAQYVICVGVNKYVCTLHGITER